MDSDCFENKFWKRDQLLSFTSPALLLIPRISMNRTDFINLRIYIFSIVPFANRSSKYERRALKVACRMKYGTEIRAAHDKTLSTLNVYPGEVEKNKSTPGCSDPEASVQHANAGKVSFHWNAMACISFILCFVHYTLPYIPFYESRDERYTTVYTLISECRYKYVRFVIKFDVIKNALII